MDVKVVKLALLATFLSWSTGVSQDLHERFEHGHQPAVVKIPWPGAREGKQATKSPGAPDDHDDCLVCQTLKDMRVEPIVPPAFPMLAGQWIEIIQIVHREAPVIYFVVFLPARAPPGAVISSLA